MALRLFAGAAPLVMTAVMAARGFGFVRWGLTGSVLWFATASAAPSDYSIAAIDYAPTPLQIVGSVKAGLICLPKGKLRWRDVARPAEQALVRRVESVLRVGGLDIAPQPDPLFGDAPPATANRIRVTVETVKLRLCVAGDVVFVGKVGRPPTTQGIVTVRWETFDRVARARVADVRFDMPVDYRDADARTASRVLSDAIEASASLYVKARLSRGEESPDR
jgi:hypothetical protein